MAKVYVLTNETEQNILMGVFSTPTKAFIAMLNLRRGMTVHSIEPEEIGTRYIFNTDSTLVKMYIEECELDGPAFLS